ncbi:hypothetical protein MKQ68_10195 [Chitinophaga horti]|uniref:Patatin-like phospholipase n=1 Tax=Chitinophaga horti TaxID=2920382 RepID=A0ABY6JBB1_9BACT|nr:hypothetical protein [Chitinophaga horti]UYQ95469.1 hypothetical protein MKQ68_10195 [Chitinophaga horti]
MTTYYNKGLQSYWRLLYRQTTIAGRSVWASFLRGFQTLVRLAGLILEDAGIEILFLVVFWAIVTKMGQGRDLIVSLFEPDSIYGLDRIAFTVGSAILFSVSMWIIPAFLFQQRDNAHQGKRRYISIFRQHLFFVHRALPLAPFWLLAYVLFNGPLMGWLFAGLSVLQLFLLSLFHVEVKGPARKWCVLGLAVMLLAAIIWFAAVHGNQYNGAKVALVVVLYLLASLANLIYFEADKALLAKHRGGRVSAYSSYRRYLGNTIAYVVLFLLHVGIVIALFNASGRFELAPESTLLYIFALYVFIIDLFVYFINVTSQRKFVATVLIVIFIAVIYYSPRVNFTVHHYTMDGIKDVSILEGKERLRLEDRYDLLKQAIEDNQSGVPYPIILVAGEGGGSRAGMWFSENLINFDYLTRGKFRNYIFSLSTVSGSSVGLGTLFAFWEQPMNGDSIDARWLQLPGEVYKNNFVGSSISGLLVTDFWKSMPFFLDRSTRDRNTALQEEEAYHTERAIQEVLSEGAVDNHAAIPLAEQDLLRDYMSFFYKTGDSGKVVLRTDRPLAFVNTCRSNDGRRGIFSPVKLGNDYFNDAIDINGYLYDTSICDHAGKRICEKNINKTVSLGQVCNTSELFPLFSAPAYIETLGSFVDGGYHENTGLKTTLDIYQKLRDLLVRDSLSGKYMMYIVYLKNGSSEKDLYKPLQSELPLLLPLKALSAQPFEGSASYFEERARYIGGKDPAVTYIQVALNNRFIVDETAPANRDPKAALMDRQILRDLRNDLDTTKRDSTLNFPLARWLSRSVIRRMRVSAVLDQQQNTAMTTLLGIVNKMDGVRPVSTAPFLALSPWITPKAKTVAKK